MEPCQPVPCLRLPLSPTAISTFSQAFYFFPDGKRLLVVLSASSTWFLRRNHPRGKNIKREVTPKRVAFCIYHLKCTFSILGPFGCFWGLSYLLVGIPGKISIFMAPWLCRQIPRAVRVSQFSSQQVAYIRPIGFPVGIPSLSTSASHTSLLLFVLSSGRFEFSK